MWNEYLARAIVADRNAAAERAALVARNVKAARGAGGPAHRPTAVRALRRIRGRPADPRPAIS
jgi:hypothetical protein